jgi:hypothetical protein
MPDDLEAEAVDAMERAFRALGEALGTLERDPSVCWVCGEHLHQGHFCPGMASRRALAAKPDIDAETARTERDGILYREGRDAGRAAALAEMIADDVVELAARVECDHHLGGTNTVWDSGLTHQEGRRKRLRAVLHAVAERLAAKPGSAVEFDPAKPHKKNCVALQQAHGGGCICHKTGEN